MLASNVVDVPKLINLSGPALIAGPGLITTGLATTAEPQPLLSVTFSEIL